MATPFLGEIRPVAFNFAPHGWALCNGQLLPISQNQALFSILGTTYGGDGRTNFALPNLQGRAPIHVGGGHTLGQNGGETAHTLTTQEVPPHTHPMYGSSGDASLTSPTGAVLANVQNATGVEQYASTANVDMNAANIGSAGGGQAHQNLQPSLVVNYIIALQGVFPSSN